MSPRPDWQILKASLDAAYVGGGYYNPVGEFITRARKLRSKRLEELCQGASVMAVNESPDLTFVVASLYEEISSLLRTDERNFGVYARGPYRFAVLITGEERLIDFEVQVNSGSFSRVGFFALNKQQVNEGLRRVFQPPLRPNRNETTPGTPR
jgi:hypothetical protein